MNKSTFSSGITWLLPDKLAKSSLPDSTDLILWQAEGITSVVNLLEPSFEEIARDEKNVGFRVLHSPIDDFRAPTLNQLNKIVDWIDNEIVSGGKVLVHCAMGISRSGGIVVAWLLKQNPNWSWSDALDFV